MHSNLKKQKRKEKKNHKKSRGKSNIKTIKKFSGNKYKTSVRFFFVLLLQRMQNVSIFFKELKIRNLIVYT